MDLRLWAQKEDPRHLARKGEEVWAEVDQSEGFYYISNLGRFASLKTRRRGAAPSATPRILRGSQGQNGYVIYTLFGLAGQAKEKVNVVAHRLVLRAFDGEPPTPQHTDARHLNGEKGDNRLCNLAWGTRSENMRDVWRHRRAGKAACASTALPVPNKVYDLPPHLVQCGLKFHLEGKLTLQDLGVLWSVSRDIAARVVRGETSWELPGPPPAKQKRRSSARKKEILDLVAQGKKAREINEVLGETLTPQAVYYYRSRL